MIAIEQVANESNSLRLIPGLVVPLLVSTMGVLAKKITKGGYWDRSHFYLGTELTLAALAASLVNFSDLMKPAAKAYPDFQKIVGMNAAIAGMCFLLLLLVLSLHQDWEPRITQRPKLSFFWLVGVSNMIGFCLLAAVVILVPAS